MASQKEKDDIGNLNVKVAELTVEIGFVKQQLQTTDGKVDESIRKQELIIDSINKLAFVPMAQYEDDKALQKEQNNHLQRQINLINKYIEDKKPGINFANAVANQFQKTIALAIVSAAFIIGGVYALKAMGVLQ